MRKLSLIACVSLLASSVLVSPGPSRAAECTKGMLWPFVRAAGDCLTDAEIAAGQKGTYSGPTNTNVDVSAIKPADIPAQTGSIGSTGNSNGALIGVSVFGAEPPGRPAAQCNKGILWPFNREPGDCLTEGEKRDGQTGVYGGAAAVAQASAPTTVPAATGVSQPAAAPQAGSCSKSWLWPFVKESGDCLTAAEKGAGQTGAYGGSGAPAVTQASATATVPASGTATGASQAAPAPAPQAASCSKGLFWPFKRESGDCPSDADKRNPGQK